MWLKPALAQTGAADQPSTITQKAAWRPRGKPRQKRTIDAVSNETNPIYRRRPNVMSAMVNDELVMMSVQTGQYFNLNAVGAHIWRLLESPQSLDAIVAALIDSYGAPESVIREEALAFLARLEAQDMVASGADAAA